MNKCGRELIEFPLANLNRIGILRPSKISLKEKLFCLFIGLVLLFCLISCFLQYFYMQNNILDFVDNTEATAGLCQFLGKALLVCVYNRKKFKNLIKLSELFWSAEISSMLVKQEIIGLKNKIIAVQKIFFFAVVVFLTPMFVISTFFGKKLPTGSWNMENQDVLYKFVFGADLIIVPATAYFVTSFDGLFLGFCYEVIIQFKILCNSLESLSVRQVRSQEDFEVYYREFRNHIQYHNFLLQFIKEMPELYSAVFMIQYVTIAPIICTEMYFAFSERSGGVALTVRYGFACICFIAQLGMYCIPTSFLVDETLTVSNGIYNSDWFSKYFRQLQTPIVFLIQASQNSFQFMACGLIIININTLISVVKVAFSASAVLKSLN